ncbi:hypothetical protein AMC82_PC00175 (plasmid) [Rhizobium phaseoli]|uniref:EexN family lipoprotein n=1 Tax=Rhizobium TaxID=379 RepID=UPI00031D4FBD|nr:MULTISPECIES: EexN family lipoprotein [Rhizobium]ANK88414.1 hypothetical protein AMK02_PC00172 [Rhizobium sp. N731]ANL18661.1 hypothetical protein AMJ97_PC00169 [Rhizobium sp. N1314]ANL68739.1 hypothetical protein AMC84_PC00175 [Rhizobium phaseoli]ANL75204.1 hypothetical protein AMC83_PD00168 [Rhizobium phaseoli]ANL81547.1 hypothetical protein AMC82_PC00175 [Rhizobium phaseoli]
MKWLLSSAALLFLVACSPQVDKIYTVDELMPDDGLLARCRNNPGELRDTPNCRNAEAADGRLERMGKSLGG